MTEAVCLSTSHITMADADRLQEWAEEGLDSPLLVASYAYGFFLYIGRDPEASEVWEGEVSTQFQACINYVRGNGREWLRLDCDGPQEDGLEVTEW